MGNAQHIIERIVELYPQLSPRLQQAANYILNKPEDVAIRTMRALANEAGVAPSTMVRLAHSLNFENYAQLRAPFEQALRQRGDTFTDRANWLKNLADHNENSKIISSFAGAAMNNLETAFTRIEPGQFEKAAGTLLKARKVYVAGVGAMQYTSGYFHHVARMAMENAVLVDPADGGFIDDLVEIGPQDAFFCTVFSPVASQSVKIVDYVKSRNVPVVVVADNPISPVVTGSSSALLVPTESPQFFPSQTAVIAVLEALLAVIVSKGGEKSVKRIQQVVKHRNNTGFYGQG